MGASCRLAAQRRQSKKKSRPSAAFQLGSSGQAARRLRFRLPAIPRPTRPTPSRLRVVGSGTVGIVVHVVSLVPKVHKPESLGCLKSWKLAPEDIVSLTSL